MVEPRSKPCPLCGATPHHGLGKVEHCQLHGEPFQRFSIWCPKGHVKVTAMDEAAARVEWGQRPDIATMEQDNAKLRAALEAALAAIRGVVGVEPEKHQWHQEHSFCRAWRAEKQGLTALHEGEGRI